MLTPLMCPAVMTGRAGIQAARVEGSNVTIALLMRADSGTHS